jgi:hypothetical protein
MSDQAGPEIITDAAIEAELGALMGDSAAPAGDKPAGGDSKPAGDQSQNPETDKKAADAPAAGEDVEFALPNGEKVKMSQIESWKKAGLLEADYTKKTQALSERAKGVEALEKMSNFLRQNPKKLDKVLAILQDANDAADAAGQPKPGEKGGEDPLNAIIEGLDDADPRDRAMKHILSTVQSLKNEVEQAKAGNRKALETSQQEEFRQTVEKTKSTLNTTLEQSIKDAKPESGEEAALIKNMTLSFLKDNPQDYQSEEQFVEAIKGTVAKMTAAVHKIGEARLKKYLESKNGAPPAAGNGNGQAPILKDKKIDMRDGSSLQGALEEAFQTLSDANDRK